jgi:uncharacterized repeat protein (TIGR03943 family)
VRFNLGQVKSFVRFTAIRLLQASIPLLWGTLFLYFWLSGRVQAYLHPTFVPGVVVAAVVLLLIGFGTLCLQSEFWCCGDPGCPERPPCLLTTFLAWSVLALPFPAAALVSPSHFSASFMLNRGLVQDAAKLPGLDALRPAPGSPAANDPSMDASSYLQKTPEGRILAETIDLVFAAAEDEARGDFENREIEIIGQFLPKETNNDGGRLFHLVRVFIMCCAADGRPIGVSVRMPNDWKEKGFKKMEWVRVRGRATFPIESGRRIPLIEAAAVDPIPAPTIPFLY